MSAGPVKPWMTTTAMVPATNHQPAWFQPRDASDAWNLAQTIANSGLAPKSFKTPEQIIVAMHHGAEVGLHPLQAMQGIAVINGMPCVWGTTLHALVQSSGLVKRRLQGSASLSKIRKLVDGSWKGRTPHNAELYDALAVCFEDRLDELSDRKVTPTSDYLCGFAVFQMAATGDIHVQLFDSVHAQKAGLLGKSGPWTQYPERMLQHRAATFLSRDQCSKAISGIAAMLTVEEALDMDGAINTTAADVQPTIEKATVTLRMQGMTVTAAGARPEPPATGIDTAMVAATERLKEAIAALKRRPWPNGEEAKAQLQHVQNQLFGTRGYSTFTAEERNQLAEAVDNLHPTLPETTAEETDDVDDDGHPEYDVDDDKTTWTTTRPSFRTT